MSKRSTLDPEEKALWDKVVATVTPLHSNTRSNTAPAAPDRAERIRDIASKPKGPVDHVRNQREKVPNSGTSSQNLDSHWDRRFKKGVIEPDVSIDLHGIGLAGAYARLDGALEQAVHHGLRVILLVTGKARSHDRASGQGRGAIASVVRDWLAASRHAGHIASVRNAHPRHGGAGALYIILKR